jgi:cytochrome P450
MTAALLLAAGFETTSSLVTVTLYLLLCNPEYLAKVTKDIRSSYKSADEITLASLEKQTYMIACLDEALRWFPPIAAGLEREAMKGGTTVAGHFVPEGVNYMSWKPNH